MFLIFSQISQEHILMLESLFNNVSGLKPYNFIKNRLQHKYFIEKFPKASFLTEHLWWGRYLARVIHVSIYQASFNLKPIIII